MFRSKKKLREQLQFEKEQNIALRNALTSSKNENRRKQSLIRNTKVAHQELRQQYDALQILYMKATAPKELKRKQIEGR
ncbi:hypothetical protein [Jeotgalicoccus sp. WY2]|uniref:hypothetical protein n=1 Tax=Jeotgalicoccus sp. WY2 TaxID=2708346 RepID=UPI001BD3B22B|nr:hypothetical protein [Jeotgalicoccus sp. WY2]